MKIVINACFGGFGMSDEAIQLYKKYINTKDPGLVFTDRFFDHKRSNNTTHWSQNLLKEEAVHPAQVQVVQPTQHEDDAKDDIGVKIPRYDPCLIRVVGELGEKANVSHSCLTIVEIDDNIDWIIQEYDGYEWISQNHKVLTYYPLYPDTLIRGKGVESQELYDPNAENKFKDDTPDSTDPCILQ